MHVVPRGSGIRDRPFVGGNPLGDHLAWKELIVDDAVTKLQ